MDLGYLPPGTMADGIYGETARSAIKAWQGAAGRPQATGFLSNEDASVLSALTVRASAPAAPSAALDGLVGDAGSVPTSKKLNVSN